MHKDVPFHQRSWITDQLLLRRSIGRLSLCVTRRTFASSVPIDPKPSLRLPRLDGQGLSRLRICRQASNRAVSSTAFFVLRVRGSREISGHEFRGGADHAADPKVVSPWAISQSTGLSSLRTLRRRNRRASRRDASVQSQGRLSSYARPKSGFRQQEFGPSGYGRKADKVQANRGG
jgi:hypothetical protein